jgi:hypothetical protein
MGVYLTHGLSGPNPRLKGPKGRPTGQIPWPAIHALCWFGLWLQGHVSTRAVEDQGGGEVSGGRYTLPAGHVAWPIGYHLVPYRLLQVGGAPPWPYKYPLRWK